MWGVWNRGGIFAKSGGSNPSRAIDMKMRGCPYWKTMSTLVMPASAAALNTACTHGLPSNAFATGAASPM